MKRPPIIGVTPLWDTERNSVWMLPDYLKGIRAIQWHPEYLFETDPNSQILFSHFIKHCQ